jgi:hypothetical protein
METRRRLIENCNNNMQLKPKGETEEFTYEYILN